MVLSLSCLIMAQRPISETVKCIGDKTPRYTFFLEHLGNLFPTAKFIHVIRDGRDVVVSLCHHAFRAGDKEAVRTNSPEFLKHTETFAKAWADNVRAARRFGGRAVHWDDGLDQLRTDDRRRHNRPADRRVQRHGVHRLDHLR